jgi:phospholipid/cholesterol/gamma-HCH transport system permease protein
MADTPDFVIERAGQDRLVRLSGAWTAPYAAEVEERAAAVELSLGRERAPVVFDLTGLARLDTLGAWVLNRAGAALAAGGRSFHITGGTAAQRTLLEEVPFRHFDEGATGERGLFNAILTDVGRGVMNAGRDFLHGVSFLGEIVVSLGTIILNPRRFRFTSIVANLEQVAFRGVAIIALISFLVGAIVAQQGIFQLTRFGASPFVVDLIGILVLRELGVLLTSIMVAGRSGSAFTAEIGSMKMREEIDALRVMGLDPIEVLVIPRLVALLIGLPLLTFVADMAALWGGQLVAWFYGGVSPDVFLSRLKSAIGLNTFLVGFIKAPFMALVIAVIACIEGLAVKGSAESLGRQVTNSVVKSIFMVIVVDGLFAMFFAAIRY